MGNCIVCNRKWESVKTWETYDIFNHQNRYNIEFCDCGLGRTNIDDSDQNLINQAGYNDIENRLNVYYKNLYNHISIRYNQSLTNIQKYTSGKKLLEVGSNIGFTLNIAQQKGFVVEGCELNERCRQFSTLVYNLNVKGNFFDIDSNYDIIIMNDVLEHFPNPSLAIEKAVQLLNKDGVLFIQLPNIESKSALKSKGNWKYLLAPDHTYHFSPKSLNQLLKNFQMDVVWSRTASGVEDLGWVNVFRGKFKSHLLYFLNHNSFYWPGLFTRKSGVMIQAIYKKLP